MKKNYLWVALVCVCFTGCINITPNNGKTDKENAVTEKTKDDAEMENSTHLKFKGVPIDGTLNEFVSRMKRKGFKITDTYEGGTTLEGDFAGYKDCEVYVSTLDNKDLVSRISVAFSSQTTWEYLYGDYKNLKDLLTEKYGKPSSVTETFQNPHIVDDNQRMSAVKGGRCKYETRFQTDKGEIILWIEHETIGYCYVVLQYKDKINGNIIREVAKDDL